MDTRGFFPKSTPSHWHCLPLLNSIPEESRASFLSGLVSIEPLKVVVKPVGTNPPILSNGTLVLKRNTHQKWNTPIIKMEHSSKWNSLNRNILKRNTHQNGTLILSKRNSLNRNIHIYIYISKRNSYSSWNGNTHIKRIVGNLRQSRNPPSVAVACLACRLGRASHPPIPCQ